MLFFSRIYLCWKMTQFCERKKKIIVKISKKKKWKKETRRTGNLRFGWKIFLNNWKTSIYLGWKENSVSPVSTWQPNASHAFENFAFFSAHEPWWQHTLHKLFLSHSHFHYVVWLRIFVLSPPTKMKKKCEQTRIEPNFNSTFFFVIREIPQKFQRVSIYRARGERWTRRMWHTLWLNKNRLKANIWTARMSDDAGEERSLPSGRSSSSPPEIQQRIRTVTLVTKLTFHTMP